MTDVSAYLKKLKKLNLKNPVLVGFGIKDKAVLMAAADFANGAIIGTAYIKALQNATDVSAATADFLQQVLY